MASLAEVLMASLLVVAFGLLAASCVETAHQPLLLRFDTVSIYLVHSPGVRSTALMVL